MDVYGTFHKFLFFCFMSIWRVKSCDLKCGRFLGEGCSGIIYEATWSRGRNMPLLARKAFPAVPADVFEFEAARLVDLDHPNIVKVLGWTVDRRSCSLVMDQMKYDLFSVVEKRKEGTWKEAEVSDRDPRVPIPLREAVNVMLQIAMGMEYVHDKGLVHGDLKPNNVLVDSDTGLMLVKIADFGLIETKKRSTTLVSHRARRLQILQWKAPELFENLLGSSTEDSDNTWTEIIQELDVVKTSQDSSSVSMGSAESKMQRADIYSFALTCSYILGAQVPRDSSLGLFELRNGTSSGARPHLPFEFLASLISACWDTIPSRRPAFIDICEKLRTIKSELKQSEGTDLLGTANEHEKLKLAVGNTHESPQMEISDHIPQAHVYSAMTPPENHTKNSSEVLGHSKDLGIEVLGHSRDREIEVECSRDHWSEVQTSEDHWSEVQTSEDHWSEVQTSKDHWSKLQTSEDYWTAVTEFESNKSNREKGWKHVQREEFEKLKAHPQWGHFFFDFKESGLEIKAQIAKGSQALVYEGEWKRDDGKFHSVVIKAFRRDCIKMEAWPISLVPLFTSNATEANLSASRVLRPLGGTLLKDGSFALVSQRFEGDLRTSIDRQMLKRKYIDEPPFKEEVARDIMLQIAEGLVELHEFGIIHRDVKASEFSAEGNQGLVLSCALAHYEKPKGVLGTRLWRAPEMTDAFRMNIYPPKIEFTPPTDVYSYGMTCYEILTGEIPFSEIHPFPYDLILSGNRPVLPASVHPHLKDLVKRCWDPNPIKRPTSQEIVLLLKNIPTSK